jgi:hypothetical protein
MANRTKKDVALQHNDPHTKDTLTAIRHSFSSSRTRTQENPHSDDLIVSLTDAYENKRARQVNEWERRQVVRAF